MNLTIKNINKENFLQYGQLISTKDIKSENINSNTTKSFYDLVDIEILGENNQCRVNIFKAEKISLDTLMQMAIGCRRII